MTGVEERASTIQFLGERIAEGVGIFFVQAEDGIRVYDVTGVQTCALPIWSVSRIRSLAKSLCLAIAAKELPGARWPDGLLPWVGSIWLELFAVVTRRPG